MRRATVCRKALLVLRSRRSRSRRVDAGSGWAGGARTMSGSVRDARAADGKEYVEIREGRAVARYPKGEVFYNPVQVVNRDLSVLVLRHYTAMRAAEEARPLSSPEGLSCLEALAASGLRSVRYAKEVPRLQRIVVNDVDESAVQAIRANLDLNGLHDGERVRISHADANEAARLGVSSSISSGPFEPFDIIDLDPYGSCAPFLASAVRYVSRGGLLCVTSTDKPVLCGNNIGTAFVRYGGIAAKGATCHETAVRLVMYALQMEAVKLGRVVEPLLCVSIDFYVRCFVRVRESKRDAQRIPLRCGLVYTCVTCNTSHVQPMASETAGPDNESADTEKLLPIKSSRSVLPGPVCDQCGSPFRMTGPMWTGALFDRDFVTGLLNRLHRTDAAGDKADVDDNESDAHLNEALGARSRVAALLGVVLDELDHVALFHTMDNFGRTLRMRNIPMKRMRAALASLGYRTSPSHTAPTGFKTDAPPSVVWDVVRLHAEQHPPEKKPESGSAAEIILSKQVSDHVRDKVDFAFVPSCAPPAASGASTHSLAQVQPGEETGAATPATREVAVSGQPRGSKKRARFLPNPEKNWGPKKAARGSGPRPAAAGANAHPFPSSTSNVEQRLGDQPSQQSSWLASSCRTQ
ncbi:putative tRNA (guanine(26)-N(2))-dimethyltransferase 2 [Porphyridium purpureum]|uniref:tRNA (guanine(26)-N(2))-dimethyltransferase n=1 Tax=Porphyridium purpureum TaxID=35688 RepID=A0A5J4YT18_PORPP|nr:putative tRNA (guanine(26)-N(2))-dimethyltransferase 2 [Porphyridium purpureum]|eukprot:POR0059..scf229_5